MGGHKTISTFKVGEQWGCVVCFDDRTREKENFGAAKILVDTLCFPIVNYWIWFKLDGIDYKVHVHQVGWDIVKL